MTKRRCGERDKFNMTETQVLWDRWGYHLHLCTYARAKKKKKKKRKTKQLEITINKETKA